MAIASVGKEQLSWPKRPRRRAHDFLGPVQVWQGSEWFAVKRFPEASGKYLAMMRDDRLGGIWTLLSRHRVLRAAQRACERKARGR